MTTFTDCGSADDLLPAEVLIKGSRGELAGGYRAHGEIRPGDGVATGKDARQVRRQRLRIDGYAPLGERDLAGAERVRLHALPNGRDHAVACDARTPSRGLAPGGRARWHRADPVPCAGR